jgi:hypothetical protein
MQVHDQHWIGYLRAQGHPHVEPLATGMEGAVYRLGRGLVAKVWGKEKPHTELLALQRFYAELARESLPFATPEMIDVARVDGTSVTIERELSGRPLQDHMSEGGERVVGPAQECVCIVLESLAVAGDLASAHALPVLSEGEPFRNDLDWPTALVALLDRRVQRFGPQLRAAVGDFDDVHDLIVRWIRAMTPRQAAVIHGDICGVNILVDEELRPAAVLDWGFLSTAGDPAFDASVAAGVFDMYGPEARKVDDELVDLFEQRLKIPRDELLAYRAAYAVATSNAYDPDGRDGHFDWCVSALNRLDIRDALGRCAAR